MNYQDYRDAVTLLRLAGCTTADIARLTRLRHHFVIRAMDRAPLETHRLEFARWLVQHGRLTEEVR